jgi:hypothetical protein
MPTVAAVLTTLVMLVAVPASVAAETFVTLNAFPAVRYRFSTTTNLFTNQSHTESFTLNALFDDAGAFQSGIFNYHTGSTALLLASVTDVDVDDRSFFAIRFFLHPLFVSPLLGVDFPEAFFEAQLPKGPSPIGTPPTTVEEIFTTDYSDIGLPLNSYLIAIVPQAPAAVLGGLGLMLLAVSRRPAARRSRDSRPAPIRS